MGVRAQVMSRLAQDAGDPEGGAKPEAPVSRPGLDPGLLAVSREAPARSPDGIARVSGLGTVPGLQEAAAQGPGHRHPETAEGRNQPSKAAHV